jgi:hypothetical protein
MTNLIGLLASYSLGNSLFLPLIYYYEIKSHIKKTNCKKE